MFAIENGNEEWKLPPGKVGKRYRDVGEEVIILSLHSALSNSLKLGL